MILTDSEIIQFILTGDICVTPLLNARKQIGSSSIDVRLGTEFRFFRIVKQTHFDLSKSKENIEEFIKEYTEIVHNEPMEPFILHPGEFVLGSTLEYIKLSDNIAGRLEGRSTWGRVGLQVHSTAGLIDPGFEGTITYELHNMGKLPLPLYPGVRIAQIIFYRCNKVAIKYTEKEGAKYARSTGTKETMFFSDYEFDIIRNILSKDDSEKDIRVRKRKSKDY